ncbi:MAG: ACT domain-containing protein [Chloroflexi bacterium]|nr:MAG: ACT domain-containing protein [Chloroflexota bacterium]
MSVELTIKLPNRAGQLGALAGALGDAGISMKSIAATTGGGAGIVHIVVDDKDAAKARRAIKKNKYRISSDRKVVEVRLANKPGTLARAAKRLGKAKVNIESAYMLGQGKKSSTLALGVKDARAANKALGRR